MRFNTNHNVRVRLTDLGRRVHRQNHDDLYRKFPETFHAKYPYLPPEEDADGWSTWQLWDLMRQFGKVCGNGSPVPFETEIEIVTSCRCGTTDAGRCPVCMTVAR